MKMKRVGAALLVGASGLALATAAMADGKSCGKRSNNTIAKLTDCVSLEGVLDHLVAFQEIADANGGTRASGTPGYDASVAYVVAELEAAGYTPVVQEFSFSVYAELSASEFEQVSPLAVVYTEGLADDFWTMTYSGSGDVTGVVEPIADISLGAGNTSTSGCEAADFAGFTAGNIALVQRGTCTFQTKAENAIAAGASAVIIFNQGNSPDRTGVVAGTLSEDFTGDVPVIGVSYDTGVQFIQDGPVTVRIFTDTSRETITSYNVIADTPTGDPENIVMVGGHLDSVEEGPGINDNGSGSAALLETAIQLAKVNLENMVRFAWWGGEEAGLVGSTYYVDDLVQQYTDGVSDEVLDIALYLNFDMVGSPNYVFKIYDGDNSDGVGAGAGPAGSAEIETFFENFYEAVGEPYKGTDFSGRSDYGRFIFYGIPAGGLFTGAEEVKTAEEEAIWGGTAGEWLDPCYHQACDDIDNLSYKALAINADAVAAATLYFGMNTSEINGDEAKGNFKSASKALAKVDLEGMDYLGNALQR